MSRSRPRLALLCLLVTLIAGFAPLASAQTWTQPAKDLAAAILAHVQTRAGIALTVRNLSSMDAADVAEARRALESQLRALGAKLASADQAVEVVDVTFSERAGSYVWVAQIGRNDPRDVVMVSAPLLDRAQAGSGMEVIRRTPLVNQPARILDAAQVTQSGAPVLVVLDAAGIKLYRLLSGRWKLDASQPLLTASTPRDLRGKLVVEGEAFTAYLPGATCAGRWSPTMISTCRAGEDPWPLPIPGSTPAFATFSSARNYFSGQTSPPIGDGKTPFYSGARLVLGDTPVWLFSGIDGSVRLVAPSGQTAATFAGWGSSLAAANGTCPTTSSYVLATRPGGVDQPDAVRAYRLSGGKAVEISEPLDFPGPVTEMWTQPDGASVLAVSKNLKTGEYEASSLSLACGR